MERILLAVAVLAFLSCNKDPGEGGKAEIHGKVIEQRYNANNQLPTGDPYPLPEHNVYIIYGGTTDGTFADDNVDTGPDGTFRFKWLRKGTYTLYTISECGTCASRTKAVYATVVIGDRKEVITVPDMYIENW